MIPSQLRITVLYIMSFQYTDQFPSFSILASVLSVLQFSGQTHILVFMITSLVHKHTNIV